MQFFDGFQCVAAGVLRGCGLQKIGAALNLFTYYFLCLPAAYSFAFKLEWGVVGIWAGLAVGVCFSSMIFITYILNIDWVDVCFFILFKYLTFSNLELQLKEIVNIIKNLLILLSLMKL